MTEIPPVGKERDKLIAKMKGTNPFFMTGGNVLFYYPNDDYNKDFPTNKHYIQVPHWSTSQDAWELWEELPEPKYFVEDHRIPDIPPVHVSWYVNDELFQAEGISFPAAVSTAWIEWMRRLK